MSEQFEITFDSPVYNPEAQAVLGFRYIANLQIRLGDDSTNLPKVKFARFAKDLMSATLALNFSPSSNWDGVYVNGDVNGGTIGVVLLSSYGRGVKFGFSNTSEYGGLPDVNIINEREIDLLVYNRAVGAFYMKILHYIYEANDGDDGFDEIFANVNCFFDGL